MSDVGWDAEDFEPEIPPPVAAAVTDKWDGEDEDDEVKDNWDDEEEEKNESSAPTRPTKTKKKLVDIIAEKEAKRIEELERRKKENEEASRKSSPSEVLAEKIRIQKIKEDSDLQIATELLGFDGPDLPDEDVSLDNVELTSSENLESFRLALVKKIRATDRLEKRTFFVTFIEDLVKDLCLNIEVDDIKKVSTIINTVYNEKVKSSKQNKGKKKAGGKAKLNSGQGAIADQVTEYNYEYTDYDDFI